MLSYSAMASFGALGLALRFSPKQIGVNFNKCFVPKTDLTLNFYATKSFWKVGCIVQTV